MGGGLILNNGSPAPTPAAGKVSVYPELDGRLLVATPSDRISIIDRVSPNLIRNSGSWFWQRGGPNVVSGAQSQQRSFFCDGWANTVTAASGCSCTRIDTDGAAEAGLQNRYYTQIAKSTSAGKMIVTQAIESKDADVCRGRYFRVQLWMKGTGQPLNMRIGALAQVNPTLTADPDVYPLQFWTSVGSSMVDPTPEATRMIWLNPKPDQVVDNGRLDGVGLTCAATMVWQRFGAVFYMPIEARSIVVAIWDESDCAVGNGYSYAQVSVTPDEPIVQWAPLSYAMELLRCQRFTWKTFALDTVPNFGVGIDTGCLHGTLVKTGAVASACQIFYELPTRFWRTTLSTSAIIYNPVTALSNQVRQTGGATPGDLTGTTVNVEQAQVVRVDATGLATGVMGDQVQVHLFHSIEI